MNAKDRFKTWQSGIFEGALLLLLALALYVLSITPTAGGESVGSFYWTPDNARFMSAQAIGIALGTLGMALVLLAGGIDLSAGAGALLSGIVAATLLQRGIAFPAAMGAALLAGGALGALNGTLVGLFRMAPYAVTLGTFALARGVAQWFAGGEPLALPDQGLGGALRGMVLAPALWIAFLLTAGLALLLRATVFGRHLLAVGSNPQAAILCGIRVRLTTGLVYTVAGFFFAAAGLACMAVAGQSNLRGSAGMEIAFLSAAMIGGIKLGGGAGDLFGAFLGALAFTALQNALQQTGWPVPLQEAAMGSLLVAALALNRLRHGM